MKVSRRNFLKYTSASIPILTACANKGNLDDLGFAKIDPVPPTEDFSFFQISDTHISPFFEVPDDLNSARSYKAMQKIKTLKSLKINDDMTTPEPDFYLHTGDLAEYGFPGDTVKVVDQYLEGIDKPFYWIAGNHDNTWVPNTKLLKDEYGGTSYFFDHKGIRFIGINSATLQEPLPSFSEEAVNFLKTTLSRTDPKMPLIVFWHHPWNPTYFVSEFDMDRVLDLLRPYNVLVVLLGHYHFGRHDQYGGIDFCIGNAPFVKTDPDDFEGFSVIDIRDGVMRVIDVDAFDETKTRVLLEKETHSNSFNELNRLELSYPYERGEVSDNSLRINAGGPLEKRLSMSSMNDRLSEIGYYLNGKIVEKTVNISNYENGSHVVKVAHPKDKEITSQKSHAFYINRKHPQSPQSLWRFHLGASSQAAPLVVGDSVYLGDNNGVFRSIDANTGDINWSVKTGGEILRQATAWKDYLVFTNGNGEVYCVDKKGKTVSKIKIGKPIHFTPVVSDLGIVYFGDLESRIYAYELLTGELVWENTESQYSVESRPLLHDGKLIVNCWDGYVHCFNAGTGEIHWSAGGPRNQSRSNPSRYYGPADTSPIIWNNELYIADRGYDLGKYDFNGNYLGKIHSGVAAMSVSSSGDKLICRMTEEPMRAIDAAGEIIWSSDVVLGRNSIHPTCADGKVLATTNDGKLYCFSESSGAPIWSYQVTPQLFVFGGVELSKEKDKVYSVGMDGVLHAISASV